MRNEFRRKFYIELIERVKELRFADSVNPLMRRIEFSGLICCRYIMIIRSLYNFHWKIEIYFGKCDLVSFFTMLNIEKVVFYEFEC